MVVRRENALESQLAQRGVRGSDVSLFFGIASVVAAGFTGGGLHGILISAIQAFVVDKTLGDQPIGVKPLISTELTLDRVLLMDIRAVAKQQRRPPGLSAVIGSSLNLGGTFWRNRIENGPEARALRAEAEMLEHERQRLNRQIHDCLG
jgi:hypothetical protein